MKKLSIFITLLFFSTLFAFVATPETIIYGYLKKMGVHHNYERKDLSSMFLLKGVVKKISEDRVEFLLSQILEGNSSPQIRKMDRFVEAPDLFHEKLNLSMDLKENRKVISLNGKLFKKGSVERSKPYVLIFKREKLTTEFVGIHDITAPLYRSKEKRTQGTGFPSLSK